MTRPFGWHHWLRRPTTWIILVGLVISQLMTDGGSFHYYSHLDVSEAMLTLAAAAPAACMAAAWEAGSLRAFLERGTNHRTILRALTRRLWALPLLPLVCFVACVLTRGVASSLTSSATPGLVAICLAHGIAWTILGAGLGLWLRGLFALPLALLIPYLLIVVPPALPTTTWRHLTGIPVFCCTNDSVLAPAMVGGSLLAVTSVGLVGAAIVALRTATPITLGMAGALACMAIAGIIAAVPLTAGLDFSSTSPRDSADLTCDADIHMCHWPDSTPEFISSNLQAREVYQRLSPAAQPRTEISERPSRPDQLRATYGNNEAQRVWEFLLQDLARDPALSDARLCGLPLADQAGLGYLPVLIPPLPAARLTAPDALALMEAHCPAQS
ncbi:hypothetical protein ACUY3K_04610 [Corynebacterium uberis]|uniref:hypothetical protein n=1 Tax=Corynebacterium TaxID=1716 RepID=UPI001D0B706F|nr:MULTISPECIES: hypothetical protein [Corynebacterium]MCZ9309593.1 hypothetical protein [Corynebacterium sp. c6VSa_13]UDL73402.1 hypothetical protein LH391_10015 [Corynebacterium uberis]UDL75718.1 hypothetical protein LH393_10910 [Corynebacterium uberis]UDL77930.1 hypothetical protein LH394_10895 [Corynebacterium uberis]UDL80214.1 hypothetical protein LH392_11315 [Corynebacterium uberis]